MSCVGSTWLGTHLPFDVRDGATFDLDVKPSVRPQ